MKTDQVLHSLIWGAVIAVIAVSMLWVLPAYNYNTDTLRETQLQKHLETCLDAGGQWIDYNCVRFSK